MMMTSLKASLARTLCCAVIWIGGCGSEASTTSPDAPSGGQDVPVKADDGLDGLDGGDGDTAPGSDAGPDIPPPPQNACLPLDEAPEFEISGRNHIRWKRMMALEQDLTQALELTPEQACAEVGYPGICFSLHIVALGGNEPVFATMYEPIAEPSATTALAVDRVIVAACGAAVDRDAASSEALVFKGVDLSQAEITPEAKGIVEMTTALYQRLLARDPTQLELATVAKLAAPVGEKALTARDFAKMACYAIASTTEFIFH